MSSKLEAIADVVESGSLMKYFLLHGGIHGDYVKIAQGGNSNEQEA